MFNKPLDHLNRELAQLAAHLPENLWLVLLTADGLPRGIHPDFMKGDETDRISAMAAATISLGERITKELKGGRFRYAMTCGADSLHLAMALNEDYVLSIGARSSVSVDALLKAVRESIAPLMQALKAAPSSDWW